LVAIVPVENRARLDDERFATLAAVLRYQPSIKHALDWLLTHQPPLAPSDMITQDEYSHDILVTYPDGLYLAYDCT
jgi:hypothetical protein